MRRRSQETRVVFARRARGQGRSGGFCRTVHRRPLTPRTARQSGESEARTLHLTRKRFAFRPRLDSFRILRGNSTSHLFGRCCDPDSLANSPPWRGGGGPKKKGGGIVFFPPPGARGALEGGGGVGFVLFFSRPPASTTSRPTFWPPPRQRSFCRDETPSAGRSVSIPCPCAPRRKQLRPAASASCDCPVCLCGPGAACHRCCARPDSAPDN